MLETDMRIMDAILGRRSIREFTDEPVDREAVVTVLEAGRWAPSGLNNQPWRFLVVQGEDRRKVDLAGCTKYAKVVQAAPVLIVVLLVRSKSYNPTKDHQGAGACIQNMLLAAHGLGLGSVWLGEILNQEGRVLEVLSLSGEAYQLMAVIALGHPALRGSSGRLPLESLLLEGS